MKKIPTAKLFRETKLMNSSKPYTEEEIMIEFAKLHVEAALKQAAHESQCYNKTKFPGDKNWVVDIESILNSYPLENIK
jgi:hypothetical protein